MKTFIKLFPISQISTGNIWKMILAIAIHIVVGALLAGLITSTLGNIAIIGAPLTNLIGGILAHIVWLVVFFLLSYSKKPDPSQMKILLKKKKNDQFQFIGGMKVGEPSADGRGSAPPELAEQQARAGSEAAPATPPL